MSSSTLASSAASEVASKATTPASSASSASTASSASDTATNASSTLNQTNFLQLLVAQIQYQDPLNPQSDTEMASQLAQFTSLQQSTAAASSLAQLQANSMVGQTVTVAVDADNSVTGTVTGVVMSSGTPEITINGTNYGLSGVTSVAPASTSATSSTTSSE